MEHKAFNCINTDTQSRTKLDIFSSCAWKAKKKIFLNVTIVGKELLTLFSPLLGAHDLSYLKTD